MRSHTITFGEIWLHFLSSPNLDRIILEVILRALLPAAIIQENLPALSVEK
jgi:hypothetical protein